MQLQHSMPDSYEINPTPIILRKTAKSTNQAITHDNHVGIFIYSSLQLILRILNHQIATSSISRLVSPVIYRHSQANLMTCSQSRSTPFSLKRYIVSSPQVDIYEVTAIYSLTQRCIALTGRVCHYETLLWTELDILNTAIPHHANPRLFH